ncbi:MAG: hypothetical protein HeimC3_01110 [Candidatus Heimdallarchaeota archaeon LC_3]|nr:MAG: hypothetical protein HeimC3_01110 [Candidatus Heimdallarchaeota archaeon LC_3]
MGSLYIDFLNQLSTPVQEESDDAFQLICECSRGELHFDTLSTEKFTAKIDCKINGICAFVSKSKHLVKISSKHNEIAKKYEERVKSRRVFNKKNIENIENIDESDINKPKSKSLLTFL